MPDSVRRALRLYRSARYLEPWQILGRIVAAVRFRAGLTRMPTVPGNLQGRVLPRVSWLAHEPWNRREDLLRGRFCFLSHSADLGRPVRWNPPELPLLWRFNLHYFNYLHLLEEGDQIALCREWAAAHPVGAPVAWHPYPTSLRIVNWCKAGIGEPDLLESLYRQAAYLYRNLETYIQGNHLLENARALILAGRFFAGQGEAPRWLEKGLRIFREETPDVVLADGGFFERSPMYHAIMLEGYLDVLNSLPAGHPDAEWLEETVRRMSGFLASLTHPDGQLALFNDSTQEIAPHPAALQDYVRRLTGYEPVKHRDLPASGYFVHEDESTYLVVDGGKIAPDHLPAHGHADLFSYELSLGGWPFVVDSGVFEYQAGEMRQYGRSTRAHNTVTIDRTDQAEVYGSFRVGRRFDPADARFTSGQGRSRFEGAFEGYATLVGDGIVHRRVLEANTAQREIVVMDQIDGRGEHLVESLIHLHPEVAVSAGSDGRFHLSREGVTAVLDLCGAHCTRESGWYSPRFGVRIENPVIVVGGRMTLPARLRYVLRY